MRQLADTKTVDMFPPEVRALAPVTRPDRDEARSLREEREAAKYEARRWVIVFNPGTEEEDIWPARFSTYHEALRWASIGGERFDVMFRAADGSLTTEF